MQGNPTQDSKNESRNRLSLTLPDDLDRVLEQVSSTLGIPKTSLGVQAIVSALPSWLEQSETIKRAAKGTGGPPKKKHR
jgi:hypothetical protein